MNFSQKLVNMMESEEKKKIIDNRFEFGCAMVYFDFPAMKELQSKIHKDEIYDPAEGESYGLEHEPHVTLLFGLHDEEITDKTVMDICSLRDYKETSLQGISLFKNEVFEVLKFDVVGEDLHYINKILMELPHTTRYPDYHPHATIAYLKPGTGDDVIKRMHVEKKYEIIPKEIVYSHSDKTKTKKSIYDGN